MSITRVGAWVDRSGVFDVARRVRNVSSLGLTDVSLVVHGQDRGLPFAPFVSAPQLAAAVEAYCAAGAKVHLMVWPRPSAHHAEVVLGYLADVVGRCPGGVSSVEGDLEEQFTREGGARSRESVGATYSDRVAELGVEWGVNGITAALPRIRGAAAKARFAIPQAYTSDRKGQTGEPGSRQEAVWKKWSAELPGVPLVMGLAAYGQTERGLHLAWEASSKVGATRVQLWSLSQIVDVPWVTRFVRSKCEVARG